MRILLVQHSIENSDGCPLGLGYVAAVLREKGHTVAFLDLSLENGDGANTLTDCAKRHRAQALGFTAMTPQYNECLDLVKKVRPRLDRIPIVMGGAHPSALPDEVLKDGAADIVVISEGEEIAPDLFRTLEEGGDLNSVPGIAFLDSDGNFVQTSPGSQVADLDTIPHPAWDLLQPQRYRGELRGLRRATILTSRGCPYRCVNCYRGPTSGLRYRKRSIHNILEELNLLYREHGIRAFAFRDDIFTLDMEHSRELCDALLAQKMKIFWTCGTRVDCVDRELLKRMKRAGCICVDFGVESGNDEILKKLRKRISKDQARQAFRYCHEVGMPTRAFFMIGTPWETRASVDETISFAKELRASKSTFFVATPYPGSELREAFIKAGWRVPDNYADYRHWIGDFTAKRGEDPSTNPREFFMPECRRAAKETILSRLRDYRHYPELMRDYLRMHSIGELCVRVPRELDRILKKPRK
jgi:radical SAM superfamily enzyme YgiQ (UPF0313 family)